jgi:hypothetical protein
MPPGLMKDFIDKTSILFNRGNKWPDKKAAVLAIGTYMPSVEKNAKNLEDFFSVFKIPIVKTLCVKTISEIPEKDHVLKDNPKLEADLKELVKKIIH